MKLTLFIKRYELTVADLYYKASIHCFGTQIVHKFRNSDVFLLPIRAGQIFEIFKCFKCFKKYLKNVSGPGNI